MSSIRRGFGFFKQAWPMVFTDRDLLKPTIYIMIVGFIVAIIGLFPIIRAALLFGGSQIGQILVAVLIGKNRSVRSLNCINFGKITLAHISLVHHAHRHP